MINRNRPIGGRVALQGLCLRCLRRYMVAGIAKYDKLEAPNGEGCFKIYEEPQWSGVFKVYDTRKTPNEGCV